MNTSRRSFLFVPADRPDRLIKAIGLAMDVLVVELEDGVALENKRSARYEAGRFFAETDFKDLQTAIRINRISNRFGLEDVKALMEWEQKPDLVILPKVESDAEVRMYDELLNQSAADIEFFVVVENARGLFDLPSIVKASPRITAVSIGAADLSAELGFRYAWETMIVYRSVLIAAAALAGVQAIDPPHLQVADNAGLENECRKVRDLGFSGKICIHPSQIEVVNQAFTPSRKDILHARRIIAAVASQGSGAIVVDGRMVDAAVVKSSQRVMAMAEHLNLAGDEGERNAENIP